MVARRAFQAAAGVVWLGMRPETRLPMHRALLSALVFVWLLPVPALAARIDALYAAMGLPEVLAIMREEGIDYGTEMEGDLFPGRGGPRWAAMVERIYDLDAMDATVRARFDTALEGVDLAPAEDFFGSERGRRIIRLEVTARRALLDDSVEQASLERLDEMIVAGDPRIDALKEFAEVNDLVESNVMGAMNSNYAFYVGLADGGSFFGALSEGEILADVWGQEEAIREDTEEWLYSYLAMAYQPLSDDDLDAYIAFSRTEEGQAVNRALFVAFDEMFVEISRALGLGASQFLSGQEL